MNLEKLKHKLSRKLQAKNFRDDICLYLQLKMMCIEEQLRYFNLADIKYYKNCKVKYTESYRRKGGYFSYIDFELTNVLIKVVNNEAIIFLNNSYGQRIKRIDGKYFSFSGTQIKYKTFHKHLQQREKNIKLNKQ